MHFLQNTRIHLISSNFHRCYKTIFAYISHTNHRFCIGTLTYNALLPVQRFFSPFWTRRRKFQRTTERCHHTEYERVCPVKFWSYNQGRIQNFKLGGAHFKKLRRAEGGAKIFGVFRVKNHHFTQKNHIFSNFRGERAGCAPPPPPGSSPDLGVAGCRILLLPPPPGLQ